MRHPPHGRPNGCCSAFTRYSWQTSRVLLGLLLCCPDASVLCCLGVSISLSGSRTRLPALPHFTGTLPHHSRCLPACPAGTAGLGVPGSASGIESLHPDLAMEDYLC